MLSHLISLDTRQPASLKQPLTSAYELAPCLKCCTHTNTHTHKKEKKKQKTKTLLMQRTGLTEMNLSHGRAGKAEHVSA